MVIRKTKEIRSFYPLRKRLIVTLNFEPAHFGAKVFYEKDFCGVEHGGALGGV